MKVISNEWLKSAKSDLDTIEAILDNQSLTHIVAFHAQQSIEKCLKAVIEEHELSAGKIHNLITLKSIVSKVKDFDFCAFNKIKRFHLTSTNRISNSC